MFKVNEWDLFFPFHKHISSLFASFLRSIFPLMQVRIEVKGCGVNEADVLFRRGLKDLGTGDHPTRLGYEIAGIVNAVGTDLSEDDWLGEEVFGKKQG